MFLIRLGKALLSFLRPVQSPEMAGIEQEVPEQEPEGEIVEFNSLQELAEHIFFNVLPKSGDRIMTGNLEEDEEGNTRMRIE